MTNLSEELLRLRAQNPEVAQVLDAFAAIDYIHHESLKAMGLRNETVPSVKSSADIMLSVEPGGAQAKRPAKRKQS